MRDFPPGDIANSCGPCRAGHLSCGSRVSQLSSSVMSTLVECVPNFSEGRDPAKVDAIVDAMKMPGVYLLDREMDADHNRCVITLVGEREAIQEAAIRGVGKAAELIDLNVSPGRASADGRSRRGSLHSH